MALSTEPTYIGGVQDTNLILSTQRKIDIPDEIFFLEMEETPLVFLARGKNMPGGKTVKQAATINPDFKVLNKKPHGNWVSMAGTLTTTAETTFTLTETPSMVKVGMIAQVVPTSEQIKITSYSTANKTITATRGYGATAAAAISTGDPILLMFQGAQEGATYPEIKTVKPGEATNYCSILRHAFGATQTTAHSELFGGPIMGQLEKEAWLEVRKEWERNLLFGEPKLDVAGTHPQRVSGGAIYWIKQGSGTTQTGATFNTTTFQTFSRNLFRYGSKTKVALCSPQVIDYVDNLKQGKLEFKPSDIVYNIKVAQFETGHGTLLIARDVMLEDCPYGSTTEGYGGTIIGLDIDDIRLRHLTGRDIKMNTGPNGKGIQGNSEDSVIFEYIGEIGFQMNNSEKHRYWTGITTAS